MNVREITKLASYKHPLTLATMRQRGQLPFDLTQEMPPARAFQLVTQSEVAKFCGMTEATAVIASVGDGFREHWPEIVAGAYWLVTTYGCANVVGTSDAITLIGAALRNGSAEKGWPVNLHTVLKSVKERADYLGIALPPLSAAEEWWHLKD